MSAAQVRIDVDSEGHPTVVVDDQQWTPRTPGGVPPEVRLGRSDVPWVLDALLTEHDCPLDVVVHDYGRTFRDLVYPERLKRGNPSFSSAPPGYAPDRHRPPLATYHDAVDDEPAKPLPGVPRTGRGVGSFEAGGYTPGEQVAIAVIVTRVTADDQGRICLILRPRCARWSGTRSRSARSPARSTSTRPASSIRARSTGQPRSTDAVQG